MGLLESTRMSAHLGRIARAWTSAAVVVAVAVFARDGAAAQDAAGPPPVAASGVPAAESVPTGPPTGPRDLLNRHGVDDSQLGRLVDGQPVSEGELEPLLKVLYWLRRFPPGDVQRWSRPRLDLAALAADPEASRAELFVLRGRVERIEARSPSPEEALRYEMSRYFRCELRLDSGGLAELYTDAVPKAWASGGTIDQRGGAVGLFLKLAATDPNQPLPVFAAPRVAWYRDDPLGRLGFDAGLFDYVVQRRPLRNDPRQPFDERLAFYELLAAVGRSKPRELLHLAADRLQRSGEPSYSVVPLFNEPEAWQGRLVMLTGTAREVLRIRVEDPDIAARYGIEHYYQISMFTEDSQDNPIIFCVRELPENMPTGGPPDYFEQVRVAGFLMKSWLFRAGAAGASGAAPRRQLAPLLIGRDVVWFPRTEPQSNAWLHAVAGALFVAALAGVWIALWRFSRADRKFVRERIRPALGIDRGISLEKLSADSSPGEPSAPRAPSDPPPPGDAGG